MRFATFILIWLLLVSPTLASDGLLSPAANPPVVLLQDNPIINGSMDVWQRGTTFAGLSVGTYTADRWAYSQGLAGAVVTVNQSTSVPTLDQSNMLFNYSFEMDVTTADASIAAGDYHMVIQVIEGYNWRPFAQKPFIFSFWVRDTITGEHAVAFRNSGLNRSYIATYTINTADTWEYKTVTVPASPSAGTWNYTNGSGLLVSFTLSVGSTLQTTAGAWQTGNYLGTSTTVNSMSSTSNFFRVTGVKLEYASVANSNVIPFRQFASELELCKRYYQKSFLYATTPAQNAGANTGEFVFPAMLVGALAERSSTNVYAVQLRATATPTLYNPSAANAQVRDETGAVDTTASAIVGASDRGFAVSATGNAATAVGNLLGVHWTVDAEL